FDRTPLRGSSGVTGAGPIFHAVMTAAQERAGSRDGNAGILPVPAGLEQAEVCALSGGRANPWCPSRTREWLPRGADAVPCAWHHRGGEGLVTIYPPQYRAWETGSPGSPGSSGSSGSAGSAWSAAARGSSGSGGSSRVARSLHEPEPAEPGEPGEPG